MGRPLHAAWWSLACCRRRAAARPQCVVRPRNAVLLGLCHHEVGLRPSTKIQQEEALFSLFNDQNALFALCGCGACCQLRVCKACSCQVELLCCRARRCIGEHGAAAGGEVAHRPGTRNFQHWSCAPGHQSLKRFVCRCIGGHGAAAGGDDTHPPGDRGGGVSRQACGPAGAAATLCLTKGSELRISCFSVCLHSFLEPTDVTSVVPAL